jgi:hypothetical protein
MKSDKLVLIVLFLFVSILIIEFALIQTAVTKPKQPNAQVATVRFCVNHAPIVISPYEFNVTDGIFIYQVVATDEDSINLTYEAWLTDTNISIPISETGLVEVENYILENHQYRLSVRVTDDSPCENRVTQADFYLGPDNIPPILIKNFTNVEIYDDERLSYTMYNNYFIDPDYRWMAYFAQVNRTTWPSALGSWRYDPVTDVLDYTPSIGWGGLLNVSVIGMDNAGANASGNFTITVKVRPVVPPASSGGGSGGGRSPPLVMCMPKWVCEEWGDCQPEGIRTRECIDENNCNTTYLKPNTTEECEFISTCFDGFKGPDEEGIDCGGVCPPCGTCYDSICNNGEDCTRGLIVTPDCGGVCMPCNYGLKASCYDSICNGDEDCTRGLTPLPDCGGSCGKCPILEEPKRASFNWWLMLFLLAMLMMFAYTVRRAYPYLALMAKKRKKRLYEERLMLETKIAESLLDEVNKLLQMLGKEDMDKIIILFSAIVRKFFKSLLKLKYEFTYEELIKEISSRSIAPTFKKVLQEFFERTNDVEFSGKVVSVEEMRAMISEFKNMLSMTTLEPLKVEEMKIDLSKGSNVDKIYMMISGAESALQRKNLNSAYELYMRIHSAFGALKPDEMKKVHGFVTRLYEEIRLSREEYELEPHDALR